jgi:hypothetical protein
MLEAEKTRNTLKYLQTKHKNTQPGQRDRPLEQLLPFGTLLSDSPGFSSDSKSCMSILNTSLQKQMVAALVTHFNPTTNSTIINPRVWMTAIPSIASPNSALLTAAHAVSLAKMGMVLNSQDMVNQSLNLYMRGLHRLQRALYNHGEMYSDETLGACMLLAMYEILECPNNSRTAYLNHFNGCGKLIQLRGPAAHTEGFSHSIFQGFRLMGASTTPIEIMMQADFSNRLLKVFEREVPFFLVLNGTSFLSHMFQSRHFKTY